MSSKSNLKGFSEWIRKRYPEDIDTMLILGKDFIEKNNINWESQDDRKKLANHLNEFCFSLRVKDEDFRDNWKTHSTVYQPFDLEPDEFISEILPEGSETTFPGNSSREDENIDKRIHQLPFPAEVKELLKELEDKSYKSPLLANSDKLGRLKLTRKAKVYSFLHRQGIIPQKLY